jgi:NADH-quinone oxidoreductase subunit J
MSILPVIFYGFSFVAILAALYVIVSKNSVHAVLSLVLTFFCTGALWMLLEADFLSITLVLVYVGAVMVLFLFVVMMLDIELAQIREGFARHLPVGLCIAVLVIVGLITIVDGEDFGSRVFPTPAPHSADYSSVKQLGMLLYTDYLYPFLIAGIILLVAIVAAISLTFRGRRDSIAPNPYDQIRVNPKDRVRLVKMDKGNT